jgi:alkylation response protein AidB-like acyl-CoA dehydrogenase
MYRANMAGVPLGIARAALEAVAAKMKTRSGAKDSAVLHSALAHAEGLVGSARAFAITTVSSLWQTVNNGGFPTVLERAQFRLCIATAFDSCRKAVEILYRAAGGSSVYAVNGIDRHFRDMATACQHAIAQPRSYTAVGRVLLGLEPEEMLF